MAVRGVVTVIDFVKIDDIYDPLVYSYQNHFPEDRAIQASWTSEYNSFVVSPLSFARDIGSMPDATITFVATAANVDLVEEAIANQYTAGIFIYRWNANEGIDDPSGFNFFSGYVATAYGGSLDDSTVTLELKHYSNTVAADLPWRKIPWTIVGPLSPRR